MKIQKKRLVTANHGSQPVSGCLESWMQNETYLTLKTFRQVGGCEPYLRNVISNFPTMKPS